MKTSIATVSISGDLAEKLAAIAAAGFDGVEIFEADLLTYDGTPARGRPHGPRRRPRAHPLPAVPRLRGHARAAARPRLRPRRAQVRPDGRARRRPDPRLLERLARSRSAASTAPPPTCASSGELAAARGIRVGFEALAWGRHVSDHRDAWEIVRRADHPQRRPHPRQLPHPRARPRPRLDPRDPRRPHLPRPARRRAGASTWTCSSGAGTSATCPARATCPSRDFLARRRGHRLRRLALPRDLQRPVPRRLAALDRRRRPPLARRPDGRGRRAPSPASGSIPPMPRPHRGLRRRVRRVRGRRPRPRPRWCASSTAWASPRPAATSPRT